MEEIRQDKVYYTIGEAAQIIGESTSLVRFWTDTFPRYLKPDRNNKGNRLYRQSDIANLKTIHYLVKECGMTLEGAQKRLKEDKAGSDRKAAIMEKLGGIKAALEEVQKSL